MPKDPVVWSVHDDARNKSGTWSTPAVLDDLVISPTRPGRVRLDRRLRGALGAANLPAPVMGSPVVVDDVWIQGDCNGVLHGFDVSDPPLCASCGRCPRRVHRGDTSRLGRAHLRGHQGRARLRVEEHGVIVFVFLVIAFIVIPLIELYVFVQIGQALGFLNTIGAMQILVSFVGAWLAWREGIGILARLRRQVDAGKVPTDELIDGGGRRPGALHAPAPRLRLRRGGHVDAVPGERGSRWRNVLRKRFRITAVRRYNGPFDDGPGGPPVIDV